MNQISDNRSRTTRTTDISLSANLGRFLLSGFLSLSVWLACGCSPVDQIEQHVMTREQTGIPQAVRIPAAQKEASPAVRSRMVTAIASLPTATWFFKAVGPVEDMELALPTLTIFFQSVSFNDRGQPEYQPPPNWKKGGPRPGRFETFLLGAAESPSIELAISELGPNQDLTSNVNRWRRDQLGLSELDEKAARDSLTALPFKGGEFLLFDEVGMYRGGMSAPMSGPPSSENPATLPTNDSITPRDSGQSITTTPVEFVTPPGWNQLPNPMFATVRLERIEAEKKAAISLSDMNPEPNTWESAVNSWLAEIELPGLDAAQLSPFVSEVTIDGQAGKLIRLLMPDAKKGIIAARVEHGGRAWFVKLAGDKSLVESSQSELTAFIQSIRFKPAAELK